jgi:hypothetical protein
MIISGWIVVKTINISHGSFRETHKTNRKSCRLRDNVENSCTPRQATSDSVIWRMHFAVCILKATNIHSEYGVLIAFDGNNSYARAPECHVIRRSRREPNLGFRGLTDLGDVMLCQKNLHESWRMGRCIVVIKQTCSLGHCECDGHTVYKLSQQLLTANWLAPRESDCSLIRSKVSSGWLPSYIEATRTVFEIFKMVIYFPDIPRTLPPLVML